MTSQAKPKSKKPAPRKAQAAKTSFWKKHRATIIVLLFVASVIGFWVGQAQIKVIQHDQNRAHVVQSLKDIDAWFTPPGELAYNQTTDNGCGEDTTSWLSTRTVCSYTLIKIYKAKGSAEANLRKADEMISSRGWQLWHNDPASREDFEQTALREREATGETYYHSGTNQPDIQLEFFPRDDARFKDKNPAGWFGIDKDIPLHDDEYLYGIRVVYGYQ